MTRGATTIDPDNAVHEIPKKHLFLPSGNFIWEIKSKKDEYTYFVDSNREYCTCKGYYYNYNEKNGCYHLGKITECIPELKYKIYLYHDDCSREFLKEVVLSIFAEH
jgi:predicted nucleic acid-binding Zn finger protein